MTGASLQILYISKQILLSLGEILHCWENAMQMPLYLRAKQSCFPIVEAEGREVKLWFLKSSNLVSLCHSLSDPAPLLNLISVYFRGGSF